MPLQYRLFVVFLLLSGSFISCVNTNKVISETAKSPIIIIEGQVTNTETGEPISGAEVWIESTTIHAKTDESGAYSFRIPRGYYTILARQSDKFHNVVSKDLNLDPDVWSNQTVNFELDEASEVGGSYSAYDEEQHEMAVETFTKHFINDEIYEEEGLKCSLQNPEDLHFSEGGEGVLNVNGPVELKLKNHDLGYNITILLDDYRSKDYGEILGVESEAEYLFEEMTPANAEQAAVWESNRQKYFNGSFRHFLIAMVSDKSPLTFGYRVFLGQSVTSTSAMAFTETSVNDIEAEKSTFMLPPLETNGAYILRFSDELRVENIEREIYDPHNIMGLDSYPQETSWVSLVGQSAEFSRNGLVKDPDKISLRGVWRYTPVCKMLPKNYLPKTEK